jgi:hypothetical protein
VDLHDRSAVGIDFAFHALYLGHCGLQVLFYFTFSFSNTDDPDFIPKLISKLMARWGN